MDVDAKHLQMWLKMIFFLIDSAQTRKKEKRKGGENKSEVKRRQSHKIVVYEAETARNCRIGRIAKNVEIIPIYYINMCVSS